jgi:hypothetical protein
MTKAFAATLGMGLFFCRAAVAGSETADTSSIPAVACSLENQTGPARPHTDQSLRAPLDQRTAAQLAYYSAVDVPGVYAPKGWHCTAWNGSNGSIVLVTPQRIAPPYFPLPVISGPAVVSQFTQGESSGRFHVAIAAAQLFPVVGAEFVRRVRQEHLISDSSFDMERYPGDWLQYLSDRFVQYSTPANSQGLGTEGMLDMSDLPIRGLTILNLQAEMVSLTEVRVRLPPGLNSVQEMIMQLETGCVQLRGGC